MRLRILLVGFLLFLISFSFGIGAMYYESPRLMVDESFSLRRGATISFDLHPSPGGSVRYDVSCRSEGPLAVTLSFLDEGGGLLSRVELSGNGSLQSEDSKRFVSGPSEVALRLLLAEEASCRLRLYYPSFDERILLLMVLIQLITSLLAISIIVSYYLGIRGRGRSRIEPQGVEDCQMIIHRNPEVPSE